MNVVVYTTGLLVDTLYFVPILEGPLACSLWLVVVEVALEEISVALDPTTLSHLAQNEVADELLLGVKEDVSSFAVLLSVGPVS